MTRSVRFDVARPAAYDPGQIALRLVLMIVLAVVGAPLGWVFGVLFLGLPLLAALCIWASGPDRYHAAVGPALVRALTWILGLYAYLGLLTDRLPSREPDRIEYRVNPHGTPSPASALARLLTSIPAAILLWALGAVSTVLWVFAAACVVIRGSYPASIFEFQRGILRLFATFVAHHASLVDGAAPLRFETGPVDDAGPVPPPAAV